MDEPKMVPESDLVALKESHKSELEKVGTEHASAIDILKGEHSTASAGVQSQLNTATTELSRVRAAAAQLEEAGKNHATTVEEMTGLKAELKTAQDNLKGANENLAVNLRDGLKEEYGIQDGALEGKTVAELTVISDALKTTRGPDSKKYTSGGGSGGGSTQQTGREKIAAGLEGGELRRP